MQCRNVALNTHENVAPLSQGLGVCEFVCACVCVCVSGWVKVCMSGISDEHPNTKKILLFFWKHIV